MRYGAHLTSVSWVMFVATEILVYLRTVGLYGTHLSSESSEMIAATEGLLYFRTVDAIQLSILLVVTKVLLY